MKTVATVIMLALAFPAAAQALLGPDGKDTAQKIDAAATVLEKAVWARQFQPDNQPAWPLAERYQPAAETTPKAEADRRAKEKALLSAMADYMETCDKHYRPAPRKIDNSKEIAFLRRILAWGERSPEKTARLRADQNAIAADYYSPHLRYVPDTPAKPAAVQTVKAKEPTVKTAPAEAQTPSACYSERIRIQNELAAGYFSPHLRYTPTKPVDNSKEIAFIKSLYGKILSYFGADSDAKQDVSPEEAARKERSKEAFRQMYLEAVTNVARAGK